MLSFFSLASILVHTNEKPLEHSIFISDKDTLSKLITSLRVSSNDDDVKELASLYTSINNDDLLPYLNNEEQLEDEATLNIKIKTIRQHSLL
jgi:hypothetical protein